ncbi:hypothetical protein NG800_010510 [Epilithonimonas ginsengisoli]|uniref:DUF4398 domain-containing protein n=1 Tax=Epilithonimonas ginsengisoli TaxID=1245592 RepID=A0ABU4JIJ7_9FLAO|nr:MULTISPECIES: hypothetical protein [Chryseobacterium group]MBV6879901.1 hypothetical protein [Epilithonimonas sp. FP105]MDW8549346.1 hypothetical protein [Epilithonimonas ginsengisoli]OAH70233.1 hypothetical protein AXA65_13745 [Chryseobacterium sp. FP211-J200]
MKKTLLTLALAGLVLTANSCKKNETSDVKIDFTQSYEDAALALATAQQNYQEAVASKDPARIEAAKIELQKAQDKYVESKNVYVAEGGTVKTEYENNLATSTQILGNTSTGMVSNAITKTDSIITGRTNAEIDNTAKEIKDKVNTEKAKLVEDANKTVADTKAAAEKAKADLKKSTEETKKAANEKIDKAQKDLNDLFK